VNHPIEHPDDGSSAQTPGGNAWTRDRLDVQFTLNEGDILQVLRDLREADPKVLRKREKARSDAALGGMLVVVCVGIAIFLGWFSLRHRGVSPMLYVIIASSVWNSVLIALYCWWRVRAVSPHAIPRADRKRARAMLEQLGASPFRYGFDLQGLRIQHDDGRIDDIPGDTIRRVQSVPSGTAFFGKGDQLLAILPSRVLSNADVHAFLQRHRDGYPHVRDADDAWLLAHLKDRHVPCPHCRYDLCNLALTRCPECGIALTRAALEEPVFGPPDR